VLGHEVGHVTSQHVDERLSQAMVVQGITIGAVVAAGTSEESWASVVPLLVGAGGQGYQLKFGRDQELEADRQGVRYMTRLNYDPRGMRQTLVILKEAAGRRSQPEFLSTHPDPDRRIAQIDGLLRGEYQYTQGNARFRMRPRPFKREVLGVLGAVASGAETDPGLPDGWCAVCSAGGAAAVRH
jgi:predicted Zn-dependent protease